MEASHHPNALVQGTKKQKASAIHMWVKEPMFLLMFDDLSLLHIKCPRKEKKKTTSLLVKEEAFVNNDIDDVMKIIIASYVQADNDYAMEDMRDVVKCL